ncbi:ABC transporter permease [Rhizobium miluonense]|uniref:Ribose transport system permease protein n=1 Tax=Rhizobium miluonense TaxID=411945 RepID=A0A1C3V6P8_9HYPH|nr:ABC transporter permease [Rhizobium miluonense]SCB23496.1 ribose transport system permease protein [Rhizobium miluonense]
MTNSVTEGKVHMASLNYRWPKIDAQLLGLAAFYAGLVVIFSFSTPMFLSWSNGVNILSNITVLGIVALGQMLVIVSGGFDLSVSGTAPLGAVAYVILCNAGMPIPAAILSVLALGMLVGVINGILVNKIDISPLIATLGTLSVTGGLALTISRGVTIPMNDLAAGFLSEFAFSRVSWYVIVLLFISAFAHVLMRYTVLGRMIYAVGGNADASRLAGIRVEGVSIAVYTASAVLAALAGIVVSSQLLVGSANVGADLALSTVTAVVLGGASLMGGVGTVGGTLMGVLILGTIANGMALMMVPSFYQQMANGGILLLAVGLGKLREKRATK